MYYSRTCARCNLGKKKIKEFFCPTGAVRNLETTLSPTESQRVARGASSRPHKARLALIPMYEPDDDDLAAEEQARSLRVSPDLFHLQTNLFPPRTLSPLTARSPSSTSSNRHGRNTIRMKTHGRTLRKTRAGDCALRLGTEAIGRSDGGRSPKWPPTRTSAKE